MKSSEVEFQFPVIGFTPDRDFWGFPSLDALTSCGPRTLKDDMQRDMELVDAAGRRWIVRGVRKIGRKGPLLRWFFSSLLSTPQYRIEQELEPLAPVSLKELKARACASLEATSEYYCAEDEREEILDPLMAQVRAATSTAAIYELLGLDTFESY